MTANEGEGEGEGEDEDKGEVVGFLAMRAAISQASDDPSVVAMVREISSRLRLPFCVWCEIWCRHRAAIVRVDYTMYELVQSTRYRGTGTTL